jgi:hypothetical protein
VQFPVTDIPGAVTASLEVATAVRDFKGLGDLGDLRD